MKRSTLTPLALGIAWLISLGCVFGLGIISAFAFHVKPGVDQTAGLSASEREAGALFEQFVGAPLDWGRLRSFSPGDRLPPDVKAMITALFLHPEATETQVLAKRFFRILPPVKLEGAARHVLKEGLVDPAHIPVLGGIHAAWQERDPKGAARFLRTIPNRTPAIEAWILLQQADQ